MSAAAPYLEFSPSYIQQSVLKEAINIIEPDLSVRSVPVGWPTVTEPMNTREDYETSHPADIASFGSTQYVPLGDIVLGRAGDKGSNVNVGFCVRRDDEWNGFEPSSQRTN